MSRRYTLPPGSTMLVHGQIPPDVDPNNLTLEAKWRCGKCDHMLRKRAKLMDANGSGMEIDCPHCNPESLAGYGVETIGRPRNRLRRWLDR